MTPWWEQCKQVSYEKSMTELRAESIRVFALFDDFIQKTLGRKKLNPKFYIWTNLYNWRCGG